uniref:Uncharacterized protein n=1 Tax=Alhagi bacilliform virus TaxID=1973099 RepID=A0A2D0WLS7_9VIRU|nr:hypothetical protein [Alhagi bacilliform virus]
MTTFWAMTANSQEYKDTLEATSSLYESREAQGFVRLKTVGTTGLIAIIKQNNFLTQTVITNSRKLTEIQDKLETLEIIIRKLETKVKKINTAEIKVLEDALDKMNKQLADFKIGDPKGKRPASQQSFYVHKSPYDILKEVSKK